MTQRRAFLATAGAAALFLMTPRLAAQRQPFRIGWLATGTRLHSAQFLEALHLGLRDLGYVDGVNLTIHTRWADNSAERARTLAAELVAAKPDVVVTLGPAAYALSRATASIPIVFGFSGDPVLAGFARGLSRPGGNLTGMSFLALELATKRVELLKAVVPSARRVAILASPQHPGDFAERRASEAAAAPLGLEIEYFEIGSDRSLEQVLYATALSRSDAAVMFPVTTIISNSAAIATWAIKNGIPAISGWAQFAEEGNLMSYGANMREAFRRLAGYVDRILKGAAPGDLPIELPLQVELVVNLKAARALNISVPQAVLVRADRVID
jgi:putative ABC transport system substrate-binding protein